MNTISSRLAAAVLTIGLLVGLGSAPVGADQPVEARNQPQLYGSTYHLQNNFNFAGELTPFFAAFEGRVGPAEEIGSDYIYDIDIKQRSITMSWNTGAEWDIYEPYVGGIAGLTQDQAAALPIADEYWISFDKPISDLTFTADATMMLVPDVRVVDDYTLVISIPGGTTIGDGYNAVINVER